MNNGIMNDDVIGRLCQVASSWIERAVKAETLLSNIRNQTIDECARIVEEHTDARVCPASRDAILALKGGKV